MARKKRIEYAGAIYHLISRGNYRKELFLGDESGERFESTLLEAAERCGWKLHAYVIMNNHYHLAVETPQPNLVWGMKWLQSTFAIRFNRHRGESGPVFQGRYKAILIGGDRSLLSLVDYIHLNPVRAGLCDLDGLRGYKLSSYPKYWKRGVPAGLERGAFLTILGESDGLAGMRRYKKHLELSEAKDPEQREALMERYCSGWFIGPEEEGKALAKELAEKHPDVDWEGVDLRQLNQQRWEALVANELKAHGKKEEDLIRSPKGAAWKIAIARQLRKQTTANNPWLAERLKMGHPSRVSNLLANKASLL